MNAVVIDTNVLVVANNRSEQAGLNDVIKCVEALEKARTKQIVVIDSGYRILNEYFSQASYSGQPGYGDAFAKWLHENQGYSDRCERVDITPKCGNSEWDFEEFPDDPDLEAFDPSDRKFVAVARASRNNPTVLNATDSDWWIFREPLKKHGVKVRFLCPRLMPR